MWGPQPASKGFGSRKPRPILMPLLFPTRSGLRGPRSLTMAFSRRFLACRTLGVPSEHGPLLSHLSVNKQSRGTHSQEGHGRGRGGQLPQEARDASLELTHEGAGGSPASPPAATAQGCMWVCTIWPASGTGSLGTTVSLISTLRGPAFLCHEVWKGPFASLLHLP